MENFLISLTRNNFRNMAIVLCEISEYQLVNHEIPKKGFSDIEKILHEFG